MGTFGAMVFHEDGTVEVSNGETQASGKHGFLADSKLKIEVPGQAGATVTRVYEIIFDNNRMSWKSTDVDGLKREYSRAE